MGLVELAAGMIPRNLRRRSRVHMYGSHFDRNDLERLREAVAGLAPGEVTTVRLDRRDVEVSRSGSEIRLSAEAERRCEDDFEIRMPFDVMEAFLGDDENELDLVAGLKALRLHGGEGRVVCPVSIVQLVQLGGLVLQRLHEDEAKPHRRQRQPLHWTTHGRNSLLHAGCTPRVGVLSWRGLVSFESLRVIPSDSIARTLVPPTQDGLSGIDVVGGRPPRP